MGTDILATFAERLKKYRELKGFTQDELAVKAEYTVGYISDLEQGRKKPSYEAAIALAGALDITMDQITFGVDSQRDEPLFDDIQMYRKRMNVKKRKLADHLGRGIFAQLAELEED